MAEQEGRAAIWALGQLPGHRRASPEWEVAQARPADQSIGLERLDPHAQVDRGGRKAEPGDRADHRLEIDIRRPEGSHADLCRDGLEDGRCRRLDVDGVDHGVWHRLGSLRRDT